MDTLDGSHGPTFTYLPIVYEDDCQVCFCNSSVAPAEEPRYQLKLVFLDPSNPIPPSTISL
jgi:hypothetical protein